jgi:hypothetical protein
MNYILDTNILILLVKSKEFSEFFDTKYFSDSDNTFFYTHITLGELDSISKQNQWGEKRLILLKNLLRGFSPTVVGVPPTTERQKLSENQKHFI